MTGKKKRVWSLVLSFAMMVTLFMWNGVEAKAAIVENVVVSDIQKYDNGFLKSFNLSYYVGYPSAGTPAPETPARVSVQTQKFTEDDFTEFGNYARSHNYTDWPDVPADCGFITWNSDETFIRPASGNNHSITISFAENAIDLSETKTYYMYIWAYYNNSYSDIYPDAYVYEFTAGTGDFTDPTTPPSSGGEQDPVMPPTTPETPSTDPVTPPYTYYVSCDNRGCKLYENDDCNSEVPANTILKYGDTIVCTIETGLDVYLGETLDEQLSLFNSRYTIPDGKYTYSISGDYNGFALTLTRIIAPVTPPADPATPSVTPSVPSTPAPVVEKTEEEAPTLILPVLKSTNYAGDELASWQEVIDALGTIEPKKLTDSKPQDTESVLKVDISSTAGIVGHEVLQTLAKKDEASLHVFTGNGVALTFAGADTKDDAKAVCVKNQVSDKEENGKRVHIVDFLEKGKMETAVAFHVNLPQGADSSVEVYTEDEQGIQNHIKTMKTDSTGNVAFMIDSKEKFIFKY